MGPLSKCRGSMFTEAVKMALADSLNINIMTTSGRLSCADDNAIVIDSTSCGGQRIAHSACIHTSAWTEVADNSDLRRNLLQGKKLLMLSYIKQGHDSHDRSFLWLVNDVPGCMSVCSLAECLRN